MLLRLLHGRRAVASGGEVELDAPPAGYLWLMDPATDEYIVDVNEDYILAIDPDA